ncbi:MAG TPA: PPC domain-containing DNA-binding protein [Burkholderiaceae bacterium]|jgi:hypothetical protein
MTEKAIFAGVIAGDAHMKSVAFRLSPGADLKQSLSDYCVEHKIDAACVISCVGSLQCARIRFADRVGSTVLEEKLEIVSLVGTLSQYGCHLHIAVSDGQGRVSGGHLMPGSPVYTTAEVVLGIIPEVIFKREHDSQTGYKELKIEDKEGD